MCSLRIFCHVLAFFVTSITQCEGAAESECIANGERDYPENVYDGASISLMQVKHTHFARKATDNVEKSARTISPERPSHKTIARGPAANQMGKARVLPQKARGQKDGLMAEALAWLQQPIGPVDGVDGVVHTSFFSLGVGAIIVLVCCFLIFKVFSLRGASKASHGAEGDSQTDGRFDLRKFEKLHKSFVANCQLALFMALWVTVFAIPVCSTSANWLVFGDMKREVGKPGHIVEVPICGGGDYGRMVDKGNATVPKLVRYNSSVDHLWDYHKHTDVWCGYLPGSYLGYWSNVPMFLIFSVYCNTGTSVQLVYQGIMGTIGAVFNLWVMQLMFPSGAKVHDCTAELHAQGLCAIGETVPIDANYREWICWLDVVLVLFLFLMANAAENTIKFGMSWHLYFMMNFMNPSKGPTVGVITTFVPGVFLDGEKTAVMLTSLLGGTMAILATVWPRPLLNIRNVNDDAEKIVMSLETTWTTAIDYITGDHVSPKRFQIEQGLNQLTKSIGKLDSHLDDSWWETCNACSYRYIRGLYRSFLDTVQHLDTIMYAMKTSVMALQFQGHHPAFADAMKASMMDLNQEVVHLMRLCAKSFDDGQVSEEESSAMQVVIASVNEKQTAMYTAYMNLAKTNTYLPFQDGSNENIFIFTLSTYARKVCDFAGGIARMGETAVDSARNVKLRDDGSVKVYRHGCVHGLMKRIGTGLLETWSPSVLADREHIRFCYANLISIVICYVMGFYLNVSVYTPYTAKMSSEVSLLVSHSKGSTFDRNLQKLLGVTLGLVLPILCMAGVNSCSACDDPMRPFIHMAAIFLFFFTFCYIYYTSAKWDYVGCLIAAFGCLTMITTCEESMGSAHFGTRYKEIGQSTTAIIVLLVTECILGNQAPRDLAVQNVKELGKSFEHAFKAFFEGNLNVMIHEVDDVRTKLSDAKDLVPATSPKLELVPLLRTPFRDQLYKESLDLMRMLLADLESLSLALAFGSEVGSTEVAPLIMYLGTKQSMSTMQTDVLDKLQLSFATLNTVLSHDTEDALDDTDIQAMGRYQSISVLSGAEELCKEINQAPPVRSKEDDVAEVMHVLRTRLSCLVVSLQNAAAHSGQITLRCLCEDVY